MTDTKRDPGYRGTLPPMDDHLARPWVITVVGIFVLIFVLAIAGLPSGLAPAPTPAPTATPVVTASPTPGE